MPPFLFMNDKKNYRIVEVDVQKFSSRGNGIGIFKEENGKEEHVEVPFSIPGDKVHALLLRKRKGQYKALLQGILNPSKDRIDPVCIHFNSCGGCRWQQITYEHQLQLKEATVHRHFAPFLTPETLVKPIVGCSPWQYRNKMEFTFSMNAAKNRYLGLIIDSSRGKVFNLTECHLVNTWFADCVTAVRAWWQESGLDAFHPLHNTGHLRYLTVREGQNTGDRLVMLTVSGNPDFALKKNQIESFIASVRNSIEPLNSESRLSIFIRIHQAVKGSQTNFYEMHVYGPDHIREILNIAFHQQKEPVALKFKISPTAFFQPNTRSAEKLYSLALQMADISSTSVIYDLYAGTGTLSLCAAHVAKQVISIELAPESSLDARTNAELNGFRNVEALCGDVGAILADMAKTKKYPSPDLVFVDPPRAGLDQQAINCLLELRPKKILYISCNPATQAQNMPPFFKAGYKLKVLQPVDQFPQTIHIENIVVLEAS